MSSAQVVMALTLGWVVILVLTLLAFFWVWRRTHGGVTDRRTLGNKVTSFPSFDYPFIRGSDLYRRSLAHRNDTVQERLAMGLPLRHNEAIWRDPPASYFQSPHRPRDVGETLN
jgi:hypothetical protein